MDHNKSGKFLKIWKYQTTLPVSWETYMWDKKRQLELDMEVNSSKLVMEYKAVYCHPAYLPYMQSGVEWKSLSCVQLFATTWTATCQAPLSMGFSKQEHWSGLPYPFQGIFPTQKSNPSLLHCRQILYCLSHQGSQNVHAEYIMWQAMLDDSWAVIKIPRRNINNLRYADDTTLMAESEEELKSLLMKVKEKSGKAGLKLSFQKGMITASGPITSWQVDAEKVEAVTDFIFWPSKSQWMVTAAMKLQYTCSLGRKAITNLDSLLKSRDITLPTKIHIVKAIVFPVVRYRCESWTIKKAKHWRTDAFKLWCWRRLLRVPWTARRSNQSILK